MSCPGATAVHPRSASIDRARCWQTADAVWPPISDPTIPKLFWPRSRTFGYWISCTPLSNTFLNVRCSRWCTIHGRNFVFLSGSTLLDQPGRAAMDRPASGSSCQCIWRSKREGPGAIYSSPALSSSAPACTELPWMPRPSSMQSLHIFIAICKASQKWCQIRVLREFPFLFQLSTLSYMHDPWYRRSCRRTADKFLRISLQ